MLIDISFQIRIVMMPFGKAKQFLNPYHVNINTVKIM